MITPGAPTPSVAPGSVPPPVAGGGPDGQKGRVSLVSPAERGVTEGSPWAVVLAIVLAVEVAVFWIVTCLGLWRRRIAAGGPGGGG